LDDGDIAVAIIVILVVVDKNAEEDAAVVVRGEFSVALLRITLACDSNTVMIITVMVTAITAMSRFFDARLVGHTIAIIHNTTTN